VGAAVIGYFPGLKILFLILLVICAALFRHKSWSILLIALLVGGSVIYIRFAALSNEAVISNFNQKVEISGVIRSDPITRTGKIRGSSKLPDQQSFLISVNQIGDYAVKLPMRMQAPIGQSYLLGQEFASEVKIIKSKERKVAALAVATSDLTITKQPNYLITSTNKIRASFRSLIPAGDAGSLIPGLILGDTSLQTPDFSIQMRRVGFSHLTAVSGANFALVAGFVLWLMQFFLKRIQSRLWITGTVLLFFILLVRPTPSVLRAAVMTSVLLIAKFRGDRSLGLPALGAAIAVLILLDPFQAIDPGFALSVLATAGILLLSPKLIEVLSAKIKWSFVAEAVAIPISATIFCTPVIVALSGQLSLITVVANVLASPVIAPITVIGFIAAIIASIAPVIASLLISLTLPLATWIVWLCHIGGNFPVLQFSSFKIFLLLLLILTGAIVRKKWGVFILLAALILGQLTYSRVTWPGNDWQVTNCDVGQGDALVINLGANRAILIDAGPDPILIDRCLSRLKVSQISLLVLTHFHADHVGGLSGAIRKRSVKQVWISNNHQPEGAYQSSLQILNGIPINEVRNGEIFKIASSKVSVLWPELISQSFAALPGDGSAINNSSIAVIVELPTLTIFAAGDLEPPVQEIVAKNPLMHKVDIYKLCHHGSMYQYFPLLDRLSPMVALISVGKENSYGHPAPETIGELMRRGIKVLRTDRSGGIAVATPNKIRVTGKEWWQIRWG
jgi:competence protein ComEC